MFLRTLAIVQSIILTAALVHILHLEGLLKDKYPAAFYKNAREQEQKEIPAINNQSTLPINLVPAQEEQNDQVQDLNDILGGQQVQADTNNNIDPTLFGNMVDAEQKKVKKSKNKG